MVSAGATGGWLGKKVFVTGHSGFVGSWFCTMMRLSGAEVIGYSLSDTAVTNERAAWLKDLGVDAVDGDVRDFEGLQRAIAAAAADAVVHLAAQPLLGTGYAEPHLTFDVNISGSLNVLEAVRQTSTPALVHVTSDKCYAPAALRSGVLTEDDELAGTGPYPASKTIAEILFREFCGLPGDDKPWAASIRLGNVIGGGDEADRLVPNCVRSFRDGRPFAPRDRSAVRPFQHVLDVAHGLVLLTSALLERRTPSGVVLNFGPPWMDVTVADMLEALARAWGPEARLGGEPEATAFPEDRLLRLDGSRAATLLNWRHRLDLGTMAALTVEWTSLVDRGGSASAATVGQAESYIDGH
ncbi:NAD-dependent epimerase/dehydratase family protein [Micromonospora sp. NPDC049662]|uniref:NAD-dependent epimerase/dehydratase family protein n=1 Tax=Micromonospora sp. NPDC049662 TaxID=3155397 RepID=UPI00341C4A2E